MIFGDEVWLTEQGLFILVELKAPNSESVYCSSHDVVELLLMENLGLVDSLNVKGRVLELEVVENL